MTDKEKALNVVAKLIKDIDQNSICLSVLGSTMEIGSARANLYNMITKHDFELSNDYKLIPKK